MPTPDANEALAQIRSRLPLYRLYTDYYDGRHRLQFATDKFRNAFGVLFRELKLNHCPDVVDAVTDRMELTSFSVETGDAGASKAAWDLWTANRMDLRAGQVHQEGVRCGDSYVIVWPRQSNEREPIIYPQRAALMTACYDEDEPGLMRWAAKAWLAKVPGSEKWVPRLTMYYADKIEKYAAPERTTCDLPEKADSFQRYDVPGEAWPLQNPYGRVPVFHFANKAGLGEHGTSELINAISVQDALNKAVCDMMVGMEFAALPQRWITGLEPEVDEATGLPKLPFLPGIDRVWTLENLEAKFGQFDSADPAGFLAVQDSFRLEMARVTATPPHYMALITDPPSGEALKTLESRFTKKIKRANAAYGNTWEDAFAFALRIAGGASDVRLSANWTDPAPKSEKETAETVEIKQRIGISEFQALKELGYTDTKIKEIQAAKAKEKDAADALGAAQMLAFERGRRQVIPPGGGGA